MPGKIELLQGDLFEGPSDMLVVPCSTIPTVTPFVLERLARFGLPPIDEQMSLGDVVFREMGSAGHVAQVAAFAASVRSGRGSELGEIERIGRSLGDFAAANESVRIISSSILGTGAGELPVDEAVRALCAGFLETGPEDAVLRLHALDQDVHLRARAELEGVSDRSLSLEAADRPPRVMISYTRSSPEHAAWVEWLGTELRANGVDCRLDVWHLRPGMDVAQWMCNEMDLADKVLLLCDPRYAQKADRRHGGVGWEIRLVQGDLLMSQEDNPDKYIPVVVADTLETATPAFLKSVYCIHWPPAAGQDPERLTELVRSVYDVHAVAPPIGTPPPFVVGARAAGSTG